MPKAFDPLGVFEAADRDAQRMWNALTPQGKIRFLGEGLPQPTPSPGNDDPLGYTCAELAGFRSIRGAVMRRVWDTVRQQERAGHVVTTVQFGALVEQEWERAREAARQCPTWNGMGQVLSR